MKCPHCNEGFHDTPTHIMLGQDADGGWKLLRRKCPICNRLILHLVNGQPSDTLHSLNVPIHQIGDVVDVIEERTDLMRPRASSRPPCPAEVPQKFAEDYNEACLILSDSPKASAALSRRCLQLLLREESHVKPDDLSKEIQELINSRTLPSYITEAIDAIRQIGNFAAHPIKDKQTGSILPVEPEEAEWTLAVLEALFDFYFVQPTILQKQKDTLNQKLQRAGKPPMK